MHCFGKFDKLCPVFLSSVETPYTFLVSFPFLWVSFSLSQNKQCTTVFTVNIYQNLDHTISEYSSELFLIATWLKKA